MENYIKMLNEDLFEMANTTNGPLMAEEIKKIRYFKAEEHLSKEVKEDVGHLIKAVEGIKGILNYIYEKEVYILEKNRRVKLEDNLKILKDHVRPEESKLLEKLSKLAKTKEKLEHLNALSREVLALIEDAEMRIVKGEKEMESKGKKTGILDILKELEDDEGKETKANIKLIQGMYEYFRQVWNNINQLINFLNEYLTSRDSALKSLESILKFIIPSTEESLSIMKKWNKRSIALELQEEKQTKKEIYILGMGAKHKTI